MNVSRTEWSRRYQAALRKHLAQGPLASLRGATGLGRKAAALGLQTLDIANAHDEVLKMVLLPRGSSAARREMVERAERFFIETLVPIEITHRAAVNTAIRVSQLTRTLRRRTRESLASSCRLKRSIISSRGAERGLRKSGQEHVVLLAESRRLQNHLRHLTHEILSAQEDQRKKSSRRLHDGIAQALIAIDLRLLTLKKAASTSTESLKKEIADTQRLMRKSTERLKRLLRL